MPRKDLLTPTQRAELLKLPDFDSRVLIQHYTLTVDDLALISKRRGKANRLGFGLQLTWMRHLCRTWEPKAEGGTPAEVVEFLAQQLGIPESLLSEYATRDETRREHLGELCAVLGYRPFGSQHYRVLSEWLFPIALSTHQSLPLVKAVLGELPLRNILIPEITVLERLVVAVRIKATRKVYQLLTQDLSDTHKQKLDRLLEVEENQAVSRLTWLRAPMGKTSASGLLKMIERVDFIRGLELDPKTTKRIHQNRLRQLAREGLTVTAQNMAAFEANRRYATLVAVLLERLENLSDEAIEMHDRIMQGVFRKSKEQQATRFQEQGKAINENLGHYSRVGNALIEARIQKRDPYQAIERVLSWERFVESVVQAGELAQPQRFDAMQRVGDNGHPVRRYAPNYLNAFDFKAVPAAQAVLEGARVLKEMYQQGKRKVPDGAPTEFVRASWEPYVFAGELLDKRYYELCVLNELRNNLRSGDIWVEGSRRHRNFEDHLLPKESWRDHDQLPLTIPQDFDTYWNQHNELLDQELQTVSDLMEQGELPDVSLEDGKLKISPLGKAIPEEAERFAERVNRMLPKVKITELLLECNHWVGYSSAFTHLKSGHPVPANSEAGLLTVVLAHAINLGLTRMADAVPGSLQSQLSWLADWHIRDDTYTAALAEVINFQHRLPFAQYWGDGTTSSSDGQQFKTASHGKRLGEVNARYGSQPGVTFYTHVSDQYAPFHTKVISTNIRDATHVLDGLLYHESDLKIEEHYTDTAGFTEHVFALCHLLGFRFAPRIRDLAENRLHIIGEPEQYSKLQPLIGGRVNRRRIEENWEQILRLTASIKSGTVTASLMLSKLRAYPRQNGLALALKELGQVQRSLFTLSWLQDLELRRRVLVGLNKGEARNTLADAVCFNRHGEIHDRTPQAQQYRASGLNLVIALITTWNTVYLGRAIEELRRQNFPFKEEWLAHVSPLGWAHINLTGDYVWEPSKSPQKGEFRPLRPVKFP